MEYDPDDSIQSQLLKETWFKQWHLFAAWLYLTIIAFDFLIAPITNVVILAYFKYPIIAWAPITLQGGGIFHISMLAVIGVATWGQSRQMVEQIRNMPNYSNFGGGYGGYGGGSQMEQQPSPNMPLNPPVDPKTVLQAPHRGIPKG